MQLLIIILSYWIAMIVICCLLAKDKGRDPFVAGCMGAVFGLLALIYYAAVSKVQVDKE